MNKYVECTLLSSLAGIARCEDALSVEEVLAGSLWLRLAGFEYARSVIGREGGIPRSSHLLSELRHATSNRGSPGAMQFFSKTVSFNSATSAAIKRLVEVVRQVAQVSARRKTDRLALLERRVSYLCRTHCIPEAFSCAAQEALLSIQDLYERICRRDGISPRYEWILRELSAPASPLHRYGGWKQFLSLEGSAGEVEKSCSKLKRSAKEMLRSPSKGQK